MKILFTVKCSNMSLLIADLSAKQQYAICLLCLFVTFFAFFLFFPSFFPVSCFLSFFFLLFFLFLSFFLFFNLSFFLSFFLFLFLSFCCFFFLFFCFVLFFLSYLIEVIMVKWQWCMAIYFVGKGVVALLMCSKKHKCVNKQKCNHFDKNLNNCLPKGCFLRFCKYVTTTN